MQKFSKFARSLHRVVLLGLLTGLLWLSSSLTTSVQALPSGDYPGKGQNLSEESRRSYAERRTMSADEAAEAQLRRTEAAAKRIPRNLGNAEKNTERRVERAVDELGNDQLERAFGGIDNAERRSSAERQVESVNDKFDRTGNKLDRSIDRASDKAERQLNRTSRSAERAGDDLGDNIKRTGDDLGDAIKRTVEDIGDTLQGK
ncbi:hypothetical protein [Leptolyngbya sp. FACHB-261]|uniref:hypothetical protein n=1 Tax=Leptolyngbya sp. FACHB-261 TaxID=2692806 RepID=UPI001688DB98|nr:hypothetical protein [Leptolyngbya sp. FACHB-261]MBD2103673.1 hypothetical protein [Leptolyngbya sp. FACHB-261]